MSFLSHTARRKWQAVAAIIARNVFLLINGIILVVVVLLTAFGDVQEGIFLGLITVLNVIIGCVEEIGAWHALETLQLLAVPRVAKMSGDGTESLVLAEEIKENDRIKLKSGDQVPCDGVLSASHGFGVNEALITGESTDFLRKPGDRVFAGSIVTSGTGILEVEKIFAESRIALMTKSIKKYSLVQSPIQASISKIIKYAGYALLLVIMFVVVRGYFIHESAVSIIQNIGALTSDLLPQGMVVVVALLFSYGARYLYHRHVLLQEISATEKIGRIKNLCMDKTGTLTDNNLVIERRYEAPGVSESYADASIAAYVKSSENSSRTVEAIKATIKGDYAGTIIDSFTFSSSRQFGAVHCNDDWGERVVLAGAPDVFLPHFRTADDIAWVKGYIDTEAKIGKRLICFVRSDAAVSPNDLAHTTLSAIAIFVLNNNLREGVKDAIQFFQARGVVIRIISGDNPETVRAVAMAAGVRNADAVTTGAELAAWTDDDFLKHVRTYAVFASIKPEQKEKIIEALKRDGFTAMVGDGANDALAIKKADLGIAMFDGAQATRQIASVVLVKNSFADLPNGVQMADSIIQNIEICASIFFNQVFLGLFFFIMLTAGGYSFPFTPLNFTFINYFTIGLPGLLIFYWIVEPVHTNMARGDKSFLRRVLPFALISAIPQALIAAFAFYTSVRPTNNQGPSSVVILSFIMVGVIFFMFTPRIYSGPTTSAQRKQFSLLAIIEVISVFILIKIPFVDTFYNLKIPSWENVTVLAPLIVLYALVQYGLVHWFLAMPLRVPGPSAIQGSAMG